MFRHTLATLLLLTAASAQERVAPKPAAGRVETANGSAPRILPPSARAQRKVSPPVASLPALASAEVVRTGRSGLPRIGRNRSFGRPLEGVWMANGAGEYSWSAAIQSEGAHGVRLHFREFDAQGGQVWIHDGNPQNGQVFGPYTGHGVYGDGDFWTEMIFRDTVYVEYRAADGMEGPAPAAAVPEIFHMWQDLDRPAAASNVGCFLDEMCYGGNAWVGLFSDGAAYLVFDDHTCSGSLINDRNSTNTPYFLTAGHCITDVYDARQMLAVFKFRSGACNGLAGYYGAYPQVSGSDLLAGNVHLAANGNLYTDQPDFAFVRLTSFPNTSWRSMGWSTTVLGPSSDRMTSVSHPRNLPQRVAFGSVVDGSNPYFLSVRMVQGVVDHGSSGSGLVNDSDQLTGVFSTLPNTDQVSSCDIGNRDFGYTRFSAIYPAIRNWLEAPALLARATITSPGAGNTLSGTSVTFVWTAPAGATGYSLSAGSQPGGQDLFNRDFGTATSGTTTGLPSDGRPVYVRLTTRSAGGSASADYVYSAATIRPPTGPTILANGVVSAASGADTVAPGGWASAFGVNLGPVIGRSWTTGDFAGNTLPTNLVGTRVSVNGRAAAISYTSAGQVNFQVPDDGATGPVPVVITTASGTSTPVYVNLRPAAVALFQGAFRSSAGAYAAATHGNGTLVLPAGAAPGAAPARPGEVVSLWGTACGPTNPTRASGQLIAAAPLANTLTARIGGQLATVSYAGLAGPGLCQFNITVPTVAAGDQPVTLTVAGSQSQSGVIVPVIGTASSSVWRGTPANASASFGGPPYCSYQVNMTNLALTVNVDASRSISSATLTGTMTELALNGCPYPPTPPNVHTYTGTGSVIGDAVTLDLIGASTNNPRGIARFTGRVVNERLVGTLTIVRTDQLGNLAWSTTHQVQ